MDQCFDHWHIALFHKPFGMSWWRVPAISPRSPGLRSRSPGSPPRWAAYWPKHPRRNHVNTLNSRNYTEHHFASSEIFTASYYLAQNNDSQKYIVYWNNIYDKLYLLNYNRTSHKLFFDSSNRQNDAIFDLFTSTFLWYQYWLVETKWFLIGR